MNNFLPFVSCVCATFGRTHVLNEAVQSFLSQDYPGPKELLILNDWHQLTLLGDFPEVQIFNEKKRYPSLGEKCNEIVARCKGEIVLMWDDDDIHLPNRISTSVMYMKHRPFFKPSHFYFLGGNELSLRNENQGHGMAAFTKALWQELKGYEAIDSGQDFSFENKIIEKNLFYHIPIEPHEAFYIYRWFTSPNAYHTSTFGYGKGREEAELHALKHQIKGEFEIMPTFYQPYKEMVHNLLRQYEQI